MMAMVGRNRCSLLPDNAYLWRVAQQLYVLLLSVNMATPTKSEENTMLKIARTIL
jgi:hypothetical protein